MTHGSQDCFPRAPQLSCPPWPPALPPLPGRTLGSFAAMALVSLVGPRAILKYPGLHSWEGTGPGPCARTSWQPQSRASCWPLGAFLLSCPSGGPPLRDRVRLACDLLLHSQCHGAAPPKQTSVVMGSSTENLPRERLGCKEPGPGQESSGSSIRPGHGWPRRLLLVGLTMKLPHALAGHQPGTAVLERGCQGCRPHRPPSASHV